MALNVVSSTINDSIAEMNRLLDGSNDILINYDISSMANANKVDAIIADFDNNGFESFKAMPVLEGNPYTEYVEVKEPVKENKYF